MARRPAATEVQNWFRNLSNGLEVSFQGSRSISHNVTKGESREHQILDVLASILPRRISVERNVVIVDSADVQSPKFDGVLIDRSAWPLLFSQGTTIVAMIESIVAAFEIKSALGKANLRDIFTKTETLRAMQCGPRRPIVTAFAYECQNRNLSFFDFAASAHDSPLAAPSLVCVLNSCLFAIETSSGLVALPEPERELAEGRPFLLRSERDTLLIYVYVLSRWASPGAPELKIFKSYSKSLFLEPTGFCFDDDFLDAVTTDAAVRSTARKCFVGKPRSDISQLYRTARSVIGLS